MAAKLPKWLFPRRVALRLVIEMTKKRLTGTRVRREKGNCDLIVSHRSLKENILFVWFLFVTGKRLQFLHAMVFFLLPIGDGPFGNGIPNNKKKQSTCNLWNEKKRRAPSWAGRKTIQIVITFLPIFSSFSHYYIHLFFFVHYTFYTDYIDSNEIEC